jgi:hypothetical protein
MDTPVALVSAEWETPEEIRYANGAFAEHSRCRGVRMRGNHWGLGVFRADIDPQRAAGVDTWQWGISVQYRPLH